MSRAGDPYSTLQISRKASEAEIEDAYDRLFDEYEPLAHAGEATATQMLARLNEARETLLDPAQRAAVDADLAAARKPKPERASGTEGKTAGQPSDTKPRVPPPNVRDAPARGLQADSAPSGTRSRNRPAPRPRALPQPEPRSALPFLLIIGVLGAVLLGAVAFLLARGTLGTGNTTVGGGLGSDERGSVVATVNGQPIYSVDHEERLGRDRNTALSDPLFAPLVNNFQGITGTRMLDILKQDSLDKLINLEVIQQEARKAGLYPNGDQQRALLADAKLNDLKDGRTFEQFLRDNKISEAKYNRTVIQNIVYTVMANKHTPKTGTDSERTEAFIRWFCQARTAYDVKIMLTFTVANQPCTSGLPTDLPLPGVTGEGEPPDDVPTAEPQVTP